MAYMADTHRAKTFTTTYSWGNEPAKRIYETIGFAETGVAEGNGYKEVDMFYEVPGADCGTSGRRAPEQPHIKDERTPVSQRKEKST